MYAEICFPETEKRLPKQPLSLFVYFIYNYNCANILTPSVLIYRYIIPLRINKTSAITPLMITRLIFATSINIKGKKDRNVFNKTTTIDAPLCLITVTSEVQFKFGILRFTSNPNIATKNANAVGYSTIINKSCKVK
jgi:hypothetical protein